MRFRSSSSYIDYVCFSFTNTNLNFCLIHSFSNLNNLMYIMDNCHCLNRLYCCVCSGVGNCHLRTLRDWQMACALFGKLSRGYFVYWSSYSFIFTYVIDICVCRTCNANMYNLKTYCCFSILQCRLRAKYALHYFLPIYKNMH